MNALKLTMAGGKPKELGFLLKKALETHNVKRVIWEVYWPYSDEDPDRVHKASPLPLFLYNQSYLDDWRYFFNNDVVEKSIKAAVGKTKGRSDLEPLYEWNNQEQLAKFNQIDNIKRLGERLRKKDLPVRFDNADIDYSFPNVDEHLLPILQANPNVEFSLFFPPVSFFSYAQDGSEAFWKRIRVRGYVLQKIAALDNVVAYAFDVDKLFGNNIGNYIDASHYTPEISAYIAKSIAQGQHRISANDFDVYSTRLTQSVNQFYFNFTK